VCEIKNSLLCISSFVFRRWICTEFASQKLNAFIITHPDRSRSRQICWTRSIRSDEKEHVRYGGETRKTEKYATLQNQFKMYSAKCRTILVAFDNKNWAKITLVTIILLQTLNFRLPCMATDHLRHNVKCVNLSMKLDFSQDASEQIWIWFWTRSVLLGVDSERN